MRYNIVWSRAGREETDMRWVQMPNNPASEEYIINEYPVWNADYTFKVQAESRKGDPITAGFGYQITPFTVKVFHTPKNPAFEDSADAARRNPFPTAAPPVNPLGRPLTDAPAPHRPSPPHNP